MSGIPWPISKCLGQEKGDVYSRQDNKDDEDGEFTWDRAEPLEPFGAKWYNIGKTLPKEGEELPGRDRSPLPNGSKLVKALEGALNASSKLPKEVEALKEGVEAVIAPKEESGKATSVPSLELSHEVWKALKITDLDTWDYVQVRGSYFRPFVKPPLPYLATDDEEIHGKEWLGLNKSWTAVGKLPPGCAYPSTEDDREYGQIARSLPENMFGAFILIWMNKSSNSDLAVFLWLLKQGLPFAMFASNLSQCMFSYYLFHVVYDVGYGDEELSQYCDTEVTGGTHRILKLLAVASFLSLCLGDLQQTYDMHLWLNLFDRSEKHEKLIVRHWVDRSNKRVRNTKIFRPVTGITFFARTFFYVFVIIPKVVIALWISIAGSGMVYRSNTDYDLVLNAVAAGFVLEMDETVYRVFITQINKRMAKCPPLGVTQQELMKRKMRYIKSSDFATYISGFCLLLLLKMTHSFWC